MIATADKPVSLKGQVKSALVQILREEPELLRDALEDLALGKAIEQGMKSKPVTRGRMLANLHRKKA